jgi:uncharacterized protein YceK
MFKKMFLTLMLAAILSGCSSVPSSTNVEKTPLVGQQTTASAANIWDIEPIKGKGSHIYSVDPEQRGTFIVMLEGSTICPPVAEGAYWDAATKTVNVKLFEYPADWLCCEPDLFGNKDAACPPDETGQFFYEIVMDAGGDELTSNPESITFKECIFDECIPLQYSPQKR